MRMYDAVWAATRYRCENCKALISVLRELGATSFLVANPEDTSCFIDELLFTVDVIVWGREVEL